MKTEKMIEHYLAALGKMHVAFDTPEFESCLRLAEKAAEILAERVTRFVHEGKTYVYSPKPGESHLFHIEITL